MTCSFTSPALGVSGPSASLTSAARALVAGWLAGCMIGRVARLFPIARNIPNGQTTSHLWVVGCCWHCICCGGAGTPRTHMMGRAGGFPRRKRILSTGLRSCRDRRLTNYDAGLGIAARSIWTISRLAGASWVQPSSTAGSPAWAGRPPLPPRMMGSCWCPRRCRDPRKDFLEPELELAGAGAGAGTSDGGPGGSGQPKVRPARISTTTTESGITPRLG